MRDALVHHDAVQDHAACLGPLGSLPHGTCEHLTTLPHVLRRDHLRFGAGRCTQLYVHRPRAAHCATKERRLARRVEEGRRRRPPARPAPGLLLVHRGLLLLLPRLAFLEKGLSASHHLLLLLGLLLLLYPRSVCAALREHPPLFASPLLGPRLTRHRRQRCSPLRRRRPPLRRTRDVQRRLLGGNEAAQVHPLATAPHLHL